DFGKGVRGLHHIPSGARVLMPVSIERSVWEYFSGKAEQRGVGLSELVTEVLKRDIEINEALKWKCCNSVEWCSGVAGGVGSVTVLVETEQTAEYPSLPM